MSKTKAFTQEEMESILKSAPRRNEGRTTFTCPNCYRVLTRTIWGHAEEVDEYGCLTYSLYAAQATCRCGASLLVAETDYSGGFELFWLNKEEILK